MTALPLKFAVEGRTIGSEGDVFIIAEVSANHLRQLDRALEIVGAAAEAGVDAVKLQTYTAGTMTLDVDRPEYLLTKGPWAGRTLHDLYTEAFTPWEWHERIQAAARDAGLVFFSTPFDATAVAFLEDLDVPAFKIASFELVDLPLLRRVAEVGKPVILSTGLASFDEIDEAVETLTRGGCPAIALLHCTSAYPATAAEADLATIPALRQHFGVPVGLSDHSLEPAVPIAAAALGATILEKHLTIRRGDGGPDAAFSLEPDEFAETVRGVRAAARARGTVREGQTPGERESVVFRRSLVAVEPIPAGARIRPGQVRALRPAIGLHPRHLSDVVGATALVDIAKGAGLSWGMLRPEAPEE